MYNKRVLSDVLITVCGIVVGCFFTVHIYRLYQQRQSSNPVRNVNEGDKVTLNLQGLQAERDQLLDRLREIDDILRMKNMNISRSSIGSQNSLTNNLNSRHSPSLNTVKQCKYNFTVYVYQIPMSLKSIAVSEEARANQSLHICQKCILEQFALEYIIYDFFTQFCGRTYDPNEADFFYLPLVRDAEYRFALQHMGPRSRTPSAAEEALLLLLERNDSSLWTSLFQISDKYWRARDGADHIIAMPAPVTNLRHQGSQRGFFHYMIQLTTPIFLSLEYSTTFVDEYPVCSVRKNIVMPYPTTDPELFNGKLLELPQKLRGRAAAAEHKGGRQHLLYYAGGLHGDCIQVRQAMKQLMRNCSRMANIIPPVRSNQEEREWGFLSAVFCPVPIGDSPSSKRMYDVLNFGCIPVVLSDELVWAFSNKTGGPLHPSTFAIALPQSVIQFSAARSLSRYATRRGDLGVLPSGTLLYDLLQRAQREGGDFAQAAKGKERVYVNPLVQILQRVSKEDIASLRLGAQHAAQYYRYYLMNVSMRSIPTAVHAYPDGYALDMLAAALQVRKISGTENIRTACVKERRDRKHRYVDRYHCDVDRTDSLIRRR